MNLEPDIRRMSFLNVLACSKTLKIGVFCPFCHRFSGWEVCDVSAKLPEASG
jgi:hypothetical protein